MAKTQPTKNKRINMAYDNTNRGASFPNNKKEKETHPDETGSANIDGKEYYINTWIKESKGITYRSHSFKEKLPKEEKAPF